LTDVEVRFALALPPQEQLVPFSKSPSPGDVDRLFRAAYALAGSRHDAEDLVQETFARVFARPRIVRRQDDPRYLLRALRNTWIDQLRERAARPQTSGGDALEWLVDDTADPGGGAALEVRAVYAAIGELTPKLREAVVAVDVLGLSYKEAARALGTRQGTLQSRLARARDRVVVALTPPRSGVVAWTP
jgi:RNA polymerase sigma-70 factor, ECF subfamily